MQSDIQEIEQAFLGCLIASDNAYKQSRRLLSAHFILPIHGDIYDSIHRRHENKEAIEARLLALEFVNHPDLRRFGGAKYIHDIADSRTSPLAAPDYAAAIYKAHCKRALSAQATDCDGSPESMRVIAKLIAELADYGADTKSRRLKSYSFQELQDLPKRQPLIKGVLDRRGISAMYGESNCGKTFLAILMALFIALGRPWLGRRVQQGSVLYVAAEGGLGLSERLNAFWLHHELTDSPPFHLIPVGIDLCSANLDTQEIVKEAHILNNIELIVIDTLSRAMSGGNENSSDDMGSFVKNCDVIREQTGAHVMIIHHAGKDTTKGARGHSLLRAAVDTEIEITKSEDGIITAEVKKQRDGRTGDKFNFILESVQLGSDEDGDPVTSCVLLPTEDEPARKSTVSGRKKRALDILYNLLVERGESGIPKTGMPKLTFVRIDDFRTALKDGNIVVSDDPDNVRRGISAVIEALNNKGITATWDDKIWIPG